MPFAYLASLKAATSKRDLAGLLGIPYSVLTRVLHGPPGERAYQHMEIPKARGGVRSIHVPPPRLKDVQIRLARYLLQCLREIEHAKGVVHPVSHAFHPERSIFTNARRHQGQRWVLNVDLLDFFHSIHFGRVSGYFERNADFELEQEIARTIANLACMRGATGTLLPQGAPSSPVISNLLGRALDHRLRKIARRAKCRYSRYADDLTFSTRQQGFPENIGRIEECVGPDDPLMRWTVGDEVQQAIESAGFSINTFKTRMQHRGSRQVVTGLVVNQRTNVDQTTYKLLRAAADHTFRTGACVATHPALFSAKSPPGTLTLEALEGKLGFVCQARRQSSHPLPKPREMKGPDLLFRRLVLYKRFVSPARPVVITEGETDAIYLKAAIERLAGQVPALGSGSEAKIEFLRASRQIRTFTGLNGGSDPIASFLAHYEQDMEFIGARAPDHPVIVLLDQDTGANKILHMIRNRHPTIGKIETLEFVPFVRNLYIVFTPLTAGGGETTIEDFLDPDALKVKLEGKTFHRDGKGFSNKKHYGKIPLAVKVVAANAASYDFGRFLPILKRIERVLAHYAAPSVKSA